MPDGGLTAGTAAGSVSESDGTVTGNGRTAHGAPATENTAEADLIPAQVPAGRPASAESIAAAAVLRSAGWHVTSIDASTPLAVAWQRLPRAAEMLVAAAGRPDGSPR
jgi:hypothetical protein